MANQGIGTIKKIFMNEKQQIYNNNNNNTYPVWNPTSGGKAKDLNRENYLLLM